MAIDPVAIGLNVDALVDRVDGFIDHLKESPRREGVAEVLYPGEKSQRLKRQRKAEDAFAIPQPHYDDFVRLATEYGLTI